MWHVWRLLVPVLFLPYINSAQAFNVELTGAHDWIEKDSVRQPITHLKWQHIVTSPITSIMMPQAVKVPAGRNRQVETDFGTTGRRLANTPTPLPTNMPSANLNNFKLKPMAAVSKALTRSPTGKPTRSTRRPTEYCQAIRRVAYKQAHAQANPAVTCRAFSISHGLSDEKTYRQADSSIAHFKAVCAAYREAHQSTNKAAKSNKKADSSANQKANTPAAHSTDSATNKGAFGQANCKTVHHTAYAQAYAHTNRQAFRNSYGHSNTCANQFANTAAHFNTYCKANKKNANKAADGGAHRRSQSYTDRVSDHDTLTPANKAEDDLATPMCRYVGPKQVLQVAAAGTHRHTNCQTITTAHRGANAGTNQHTDSQAFSNSNGQSDTRANCCAYKTANFNPYCAANFKSHCATIGGANKQSNSGADHPPQPNAIKCADYDPHTAAYAGAMPRLLISHTSGHVDVHLACLLTCAIVPTSRPTALPSRLPTRVPTRMPIREPTTPPNPAPTTATPTAIPTKTPTAVPTATTRPSAVPTPRPTPTPTVTARPTPAPTAVPTTAQPVLSASTSVYDFGPELGNDEIRSAVCPPGSIVTGLGLRSGGWLDAINTLACTDSAGIITTLFIRAGGDGGSPATFSNAQGFNGASASSTLGFEQKLFVSRFFMTADSFANNFGRYGQSGGPGKEVICAGTQKITGLRYAVTFIESGDAYVSGFGVVDLGPTKRATAIVDTVCPPRYVVTAVTLLSSDQLDTIVSLTCTSGDPSAHNSGPVVLPVRTNNAYAVPPQTSTDSPTPAPTPMPTVSPAAVTVSGRNGLPFNGARTGTWSVTAPQGAVTVASRFTVTVDSFATFSRPYGLMSSTAAVNTSCPSHLVFIGLRTVAIKGVAPPRSTIAPPYVAGIGSPQICRFFSITDKPRHGDLT
ncbi:hypothetical protein JKP88DRAFT_245690 [Tribonema minus]|uniref:Uncharacterized protein n=1 Tax=Tribonema minus TaxID=303371 RepID=A0A835YY81_9STRA|nr:hypothetical protein JKP88DRAFT_245690 [Tribonema minus]